MFNCSIPPNFSLPLPPQLEVFTFLARTYSPLPVPSVTFTSLFMAQLHSIRAKRLNFEQRGPKREKGRSPPDEAEDNTTQHLYTRGLPSLLLQKCTLQDLEAFSSRSPDVSR